MGGLLRLCCFIGIRFTWLLAEVHASCVNHSTLDAARSQLSDPTMWRDACRAGGCRVRKKRVLSAHSRRRNYDGENGAKWTKNMNIALDILGVVSVTLVLVGLINMTDARRRHGFWCVVTSISAVVAAFCVWSAQILGWATALGVSWMAMAGLLFAGAVVVMAVIAAIFIPFAIWINGPLPRQRGNGRPSAKLE